jgi:hypothetical protein
MLVRHFLNNNICNYVKNLPKKEIFKIGKGDAIHLTSFYDFYDEKNELHKPLKPLIDFHLKVLDENKLKYNANRIFIENRDIIFNNNSFDGKLHQDSINDEGESCYTAVYYYRLDKEIKGGELLFYPFGKFKPQINKIVYFDGDLKHRMGFASGNGIRGSIITCIKKMS